MDAPSEEFENILDVLDPDTSTGNAAGDVFITNIGSQSGVSGGENIFDVDSEHILMKINSPSDTSYGASFVMQLKYDKFDNDRIYGHGLPEGISFRYTLIHDRDQLLCYS